MRARPGPNPYLWSAVSNPRCLLALAGYPSVVEPFLAAHEQVRLWSWLFVLFALLCAAVAWITPKATGAAETPTASPAPSRTRIVLWLALSATGSMMLLAVTNHLTQNVAAVPLLWLVPLTLYLLSFILT